MGRQAGPCWASPAGREAGASRDPGSLRRWPVLALAAALWICCPSFQNSCSEQDRTRRHQSLHQSNTGLFVNLRSRGVLRRFYRKLQPRALEVIISGPSALSHRCRANEIGEDHVVGWQGHSHLKIVPVASHRRQQETAFLLNN